MLQQRLEPDVISHNTLLSALEKDSAMVMRKFCVQAVLSTFSTSWNLDEVPHTPLRGYRVKEFSAGWAPPPCTKVSAERIAPAAWVDDVG